MPLRVFRVYLKGARVVWKILNSRKFAIYTLTFFLFLLVMSTFLPSYYTLSEEEWLELERDRPALFWVASYFSTPFLVKNPVFITVSLFLFLSTLTCTIDRTRKWYRSRDSEFSKDKAFSFSIQEKSYDAPETVAGRIRETLIDGRWRREEGGKDGGVIISGRKGMSGFWGSVAFHAGLLLCFLAAPLTALTAFRGELLVPEDMDVRLREGLVSFEGGDPTDLPDVTVNVRDFRAEYYEGKYHYDFGGTVSFKDRSDETSLPFAINREADFKGYQFSLQSYGFSPRVVIRKGGRVIFDYYLNLRHPMEGDYFEVQGEGLNAFVMFFPDFFREGSKIGSRSNLPKNPVTMVRLLRGGEEVFKGLFRQEDERISGEYVITVGDYRHWVNLIVARETGMTVLIIGFAVGLAGLFVRFLSNERRLEFDLSHGEDGTAVIVSGYSRYYPAFLEKEVVEMAGNIKGAKA